MRSGVIVFQLGSLIPAGVTSEELMIHVINFDHSNLVE